MYLKLTYAAAPTEPVAIALRCSLGKIFTLGYTSSKGKWPFALTLSGIVVSRNHLRGNRFHRHRLILRSYGGFSLNNQHRAGGMVEDVVADASQQHLRQPPPPPAS